MRVVIKCPGCGGSGRWTMPLGDCRTCEGRTRLEGELEEVLVSSLRVAPGTVVVVNGLEPEDDFDFQLQREVARVAGHTEFAILWLSDGVTVETMPVDQLRELCFGEDAGPGRNDD